MQAKRVSVCNTKTQNCILNDIESLVTNLIKDRQKHKKNTYTMFYTREYKKLKG